MKHILFIIFYVLSSLFCTHGSIPRVWERIPKYFVDNQVQNFLNENRITNCYNYLESPTNLLLKCWRDNSLVDVSIDIKPSYKKKHTLNSYYLSVVV